MAVKLSVFDPAQHLEDAGEMAAYLEDALASGDTGVITDAVGVIARARGMTQLAAETGLSRQALYRSLSAEGRPEFGTVLKVINAVGLTFSARPIGALKENATGAADAGSAERL